MLLFLDVRNWVTMTLYNFHAKRVMTE